MYKVLSLTTTKPSGQSSTAVVPRSESLVFIDDPCPFVSRSAGAAVLNPVKSSVFFFPFIEDIYYGSVSFQKFGKYEVPNGGSVQSSGFSWCFKYLPSEESSMLPVVDASATSGDGMAAAFAKVARITGLPNFAASLAFTRAAEMTVPLWLPGPCERIAHPRVTHERELFFKSSRIPSSWSSKIAVTFPYAPGTLLARAVKSLPPDVVKVHFFVKTAEHASQLQNCVKMVSKIPAIRALAVDYGVSGLPAGQPVNLAGGEGNIAVLLWPYVTDDLSCSIVLQTLRENPRLEHLTIGGPQEHVMTILRAISYRIHLTSLSVDLSICENPLEIINFLAYPRDEMVYNLQTISLAFKTMPLNSALRDLFSHHSGRLTTVRLTEAIPLPHPICSKECRSGLFPKEMPHLEQVTFVNLTCSAAAVAQVVALNKPIRLRLNVAAEDTFKLNAYLGCTTYPPIQSKVTCLELFDSRSLPNLLINPYIWRGLKQVHLSKLPLKDISIALLLATYAETLTMEIEFEPNHAVYPGGDEIILDHSDPRYVFIGNETPWNALRNCTGLRKLGIFFLTAEGHRWSSPTLDARIYFSGIKFMPHLKLFTANLISAQLMYLLQELNGRRQDFKFRASVY